jgi:hypothetical protein
LESTGNVCTESNLERSTAAWLITKHGNIIMLVNKGIPTMEILLRNTIVRDQ